MANAFRRCLVTQRVIERLRGVGVNLNPYYLFREGVRPHQQSWPDVAREFSSSLLTPADVGAVAGCTAWRTVEQVQGRLDKGHLCVLLKDGERTMG